MPFQPPHYTISHQEYALLLHLRQQSLTNTVIADQRLLEFPVPVRNHTAYFDQGTRFNMATDDHGTITMNEFVVSYAFLYITN